MFQRALICLFAATLVTGCAVKEENWKAESASASCKFSKRCATASFWADHDNVGECIDASMLIMDENDEYYSTCTFVQENAERCLDALNASCKDAGANYETMFEPCLTVYDCGGDGTDAR